MKGGTEGCNSRPSVVHLTKALKWLISFRNSPLSLRQLYYWTAYMAAFKLIGVDSLQSLRCSLLNEAPYEHLGYHLSACRGCTCLRTHGDVVAGLPVILIL
jgi:hypothetical protein